MRLAHAMSSKMLSVVGSRNAALQKLPSAWKENGLFFAQVRAYDPTYHLYFTNVHLCSCQCLTRNCPGGAQLDSHLRGGNCRIVLGQNLFNLCNETVATKHIGMSFQVALGKSFRTTQQALQSNAARHATFRSLPNVASVLPEIHLRASGERFFSPGPRMAQQLFGACRRSRLPGRWISLGCRKTQAIQLRIF